MVTHGQIVGMMSIVGRMNITQSVVDIFVKMEGSQWNRKSKKQKSNFSYLSTFILIGIGYTILLIGIFDWFRTRYYCCILLNFFNVFKKYTFLNYPFSSHPTFLCHGLWSVCLTNIVCWCFHSWICQMWAWCPGTGPLLSVGGARVRRCRPEGHKADTHGHQHISQSVCPGHSVHNIAVRIFPGILLLRSVSCFPRASLPVHSSSSTGLGPVPSWPGHGVHRYRYRCRDQHSVQV